MTFSIIIINYKTCQLTANCLNSLFKLNSPLIKEIIVIDNASGDNSLEILTKKFSSRIKIIANSKNVGFAGGNNQGAAKASGDYLLFLNSDTVITEDIFKSSLDLFQADQEIGIVSSRLETADNKTQENYYGKFPSLLTLIFKNRLKTKEESNIKQESFSTDWVSGCALIIKSELFKKLGGWDDNFFLYFEDVDICQRAQELGYKTVVNDQVSLTHLGGQSLSQNSKRKKYYYQAQNYYFRKHYGKLREIIMRIVRWPLKLIKTL